MGKDTNHKKLFSAENLTCIRGARTLFSGLSISLAASEGLLLRGPNGSGKTSLLRILAGFLPPQEGSFTWDGETSARARDLVVGRTHYLGHTYGLKPYLTVRENLTIWGSLFGGTEGFEKAARRTGVEGLLEFPVKFLSEGQKKRVNLARFLVTSLPLWLMDEPASGLDREGVQILGALIEDHLKEGGIVIAATHQDLGLKGIKTLTLGGGKGRFTH